MTRLQALTRASDLLTCSRSNDLTHDKFDAFEVYFRRLQSKLHTVTEHLAYEKLMAVLPVTNVTALHRKEAEISRDDFVGSNVAAYTRAQADHYNMSAKKSATWARQLEGELMDTPAEDATVTGATPANDVVPKLPPPPGLPILTPPEDWSVNPSGANTPWRDRKPDHLLQLW